MNCSGLMPLVQKEASLEGKEEKRGTVLLLIEGRFPSFIQKNDQREEGRGVFSALPLKFHPRWIKKGRKKEKAITPPLLPKKGEINPFRHRDSVSQTGKKRGSLI